MSNVNDQLTEIIAATAEAFERCRAAGRGSVRLEIADRFVALAHFTRVDHINVYGPVTSRYVDFRIYVRGKLIADRTVIGSPTFAEFDEWIGASRPAIDDANSLTA